MSTSKGEYDDRCFVVGNIFGGLQALRKIEIHIPESTDEDDDTFCTNDYANHFFDALTAYQLSPVMVEKPRRTP